MKRIVVVLAVALATAGIAFAQADNSTQGSQPQFGGPGPGGMMGGFAGGPGFAATTTTIEGKLVFVDDTPALQAKDKTYIIRMPRFYYYAYTDNIREGAQMKLTGYVLPTFPGQDKPFFMVRTATIGSKTYDFSTLVRGFGGRGIQERGRGGYGMGGYGPGMMGYGPMGGGW